MRIDLGEPQSWTASSYEDPLTLELCAGPVFATREPCFVVALDAEGTPWALLRRCPHAGADLCRSARPGPRRGQLSCVHKRYVLDVTTGELIDNVSARPVCPLERYPIVMEDGTAYAVCADTAQTIIEPRRPLDVGALVAE